MKALNLMEHYERVFRRTKDTSVCNRPEKRKTKIFQVSSLSLSRSLCTAHLTATDRLADRLVTDQTDSCTTSDWAKSIIRLYALGQLPAKMMSLDMDRSWRIVHALHGVNCSWQNGKWSAE